jgi:LmbE family N-acetylglucosaminyl deacetylase
MQRLLIIIVLGLFCCLPLSADAERIVIFAPHPDDETIGLGGFIVDRIISGAEVTGVMITDGEAFTKAIRKNRLAKKPILSSIDYVKLGKIRRKEAIEAFLALGIKQENQIFMGYPGNSLARIHAEKNSEKLIKSKATRRRFGLADWYGKKRHQAFTRKNFINDIDEILLNTRPSLIIIPVPFDTNQDHAAANKLIMERIIALNLQVSIKGYLVHKNSKRSFPKPYGYKPESGIDDPLGLPAPDRYFPSLFARKKKEIAVLCHQTQIKLKDNFLLSFLRTEELFWDLQIIGK